MIIPYRSEDAFLADIAHATQSEPDNLHLWWLGQSGYLVCYRGLRFLFDPYLSDSLTTKYANTDKPHTRMTEQVIAPERLTGISFITSTHNHTDHLDAKTLLPLFQSNPKARLILPKVNQDFAANRLGEEHRARFMPLEIGERETIGNTIITGVAAAHEELSPAFMGFIVEIGPFKLYHSGDTVLYEGMSEILAAHNIDIALLPINGRAPERHVSGNLWGHEAAELAKESGVKTVVPCHYEMFAFNTATTEEFVTTCEAIGQAYAVLRAGERLTLPAP
jgi:L-ascorbate metabolism protein UlaG (beta-lactamase superfamily)